MAKKIESSPTKYYHYYPTVVAVVVAKYGKQMNAMSVAWNMGLSFDPPLFGILVAPKRLTHELIVKAGEFTVNFLPYEKAHIIAACGRTVGKEIDKFAAFGIKTEKARRISSPILKDAYASYECKVRDRHSIGDHTLFVGEIVQVHYSPRAFDKDGLPNIKNIVPALYLGSDRYLKARPVEVKIIGKEVVEKMISRKYPEKRY